MKTSANYLNAARGGAAAGWLPARAAKPRAIDFSHWLSRAARGHTWNGDARSATARQRGHA